MPGTLHVVATPIGNLEDITLRALRVLREAAVIAAEDTRRTAKLLAHHGIATPTISFHAHNARSRVPQLIGRLERGDSIALVSDAGTPLVSDPGLELVRACLERQIPVDPIPGASAVLTALVGSGFSTVPVLFAGFVPSKAKPRSAFWTSVSETPHTLVFFETPHRIEVSLGEAQPYLGNRLLCVARELTKMHQEFMWGTAVDLAKRLNKVRGEITVVVSPKVLDEASTPALPSEAALIDEFRRLTNSSHSRRDAISVLAQKYRRSSRDVYRLLEAAKGRVS